MLQRSPRGDFGIGALVDRRVTNKSFARRVGKKLSTEKKELLENFLPKYELDSDFLMKLSSAPSEKKIFMEIGFGDGEHLASMALREAESFFLGVEVYKNGVGEFLKSAKKLSLENFALWPGDADEILNALPPGFLAGIYILFPDPWTKTSHLKRRLLNSERLAQMKRALRRGGFIAFASDIGDYFFKSLKLLSDCRDFRLSGENFSEAWEGYFPTKYHRKALREGREARFFKFLYR